MKVIHLTDKEFSLRPIIPDGDVGNCKPEGSLWFSPETRDWEEWCKRNSSDRAINFEVVCDLDETNLLKIDSPKDIQKLPMIQVTKRDILTGKQYLQPAIDWERLYKSGVDAVYVTDNMISSIPWIEKTNCFSTWDAPSIAVLNERCIKSCEMKQKKCYYEPEEDDYYEPE